MNVSLKNFFLKVVSDLLMEKKNEIMNCPRAVCVFMYVTCVYTLTVFMGFCDMTLSRWW
jgi:hypothetical protein